jgi:hypothetical protein
MQNTPLSWALFFGFLLLIIYFMWRMRPRGTSLFYNIKCTDNHDPPLHFVNAMLRCPSCGHDTKTSNSSSANPPVPCVLSMIALGNYRRLTCRFFD